MDGISLPVGKGRLIALVPECLINNIELINKIYEMAAREKREVYYLALVDQESKVLATSRSLATLKALVVGGKLSPASRVVETSQWMAALCEIYRPGDIILCQAEQQVRDGFLHVIPASDFVLARLNAPVQTISGFYKPEQVQVSRWLNSMAYWMGQLAIIGSSFMLEIRLDQSIHGLMRTAMLIIVLLVALGAGAAWDRLIS